jgi:hypothetical protein
MTMDALQIVETVTDILRRDPRFPKLSSLEYIALFADLQRDLEVQIAHASEIDFQAGYDEAIDHIGYEAEQQKGKANSNRSGEPR